MNIYGNSSQRAPSSGNSFDSYQFDFGVAGSARSTASRPLRDPKSIPTATATAAKSAATSSNRSYQSNKPSWTHQPAAATAPAAAPRSGNLASGPASMVGDIFGKSWASVAHPSSASGSGIQKADPYIFSDLVGSALGQGRGAGGNVPLKSAAPRHAFSLSNLSNSLPKSTVNAAAASATAAGSTPMRPNSWVSPENPGNFSSFAQSGPKIGTPMGGGGQPMKLQAGAALLNTGKDPFGSLMNFGSKPSVKAPMSSVNSSNTSSSGAGAGDFLFEPFQNVNSARTSDFGTQGQSFSAPPPQQQPAPVKSGADPLDMFFTSSKPAAPAAGAASEASGIQPFTEMNDWDVGSEFGGHDGGGPTTELEGLPPPPAGVTAPVAKAKGMDNYKHGQFADAIKWLSWAFVLLEKSGDSSSASEVLSCRASCYKEVGEYKKAVADCSKILEQDSANVSILVQRALLYESMEKYKLGAEDLRMVLKIDPGNRIAKSTIHRLSKFAD